MRLNSVRRAAMVAIGALALTMGTQSLASAAPETDWRIAAQAEIDAYTEAHPDDFVGIDRLLGKYGLPAIKVSVSGVAGELSGAQAKKIVDQRKLPTSNRGEVGTNAVPTDAFGVWVANQKDLYGGRKVTGNWNFRDNFVNGSAPDDVATIQTNLADGCYRINGTPTYRVSDYTGAVQSGRLYLDDAGVNGSPILGIRDGVSGFRLLVDNGYFVANYKLTGKSGCSSSTKMGAQFQYEHNQDGGSGWSASAGWGVFSISYQNPGSKLRKSSGALWV